MLVASVETNAFNINKIQVESGINEHIFHTSTKTINNINTSFNFLTKYFLEFFLKTKLNIFLGSNQTVVKILAIAVAIIIPNSFIAGSVNKLPNITDNIRFKIDVQIKIYLTSLNTPVVSLYNLSGCKKANYYKIYYCC